MKQKMLTVLILFFLGQSALNAQDKYYTKTGRVFFECTRSALEKVEAINKSVTCVMDIKTGNIQFAVLMKGFEFKKALMQEHFNENYVESDKFPKSEFKGQVVNRKDINFSKNGNYTAKVKGNLLIHGVTKEVETIGTISVKDGKFSIKASFEILLSDYKISIPSLVSDKISNTAKITMEGNLDPLKS
jgi:hypothetical protein